MHASRRLGNPQLGAVFSFLPLLLSVSCSGAGFAEADETTTENAGVVKQAVSTPLSICNQDPRVTSGLVSATVCAGARVFFDEKFDGNGRTCGSCHPVANNFTIDGMFVASLQPSNALFVAENQPSTLGALEDTAALHSNEALIRENVDGFVENRFVARSVPHTLS